MLLSGLKIQPQACLSAKQAAKCSGTCLRPERLYPLCVLGEEGGRFTLVVHAVVHETGSGMRGESVVFRKVQEREDGCTGKAPTRWSESDCQVTIPRRQRKRLGSVAVPGCPKVREDVLQII